MKYIIYVSFKFPLRGVRYRYRLRPKKWGQAS